MEPATVVGAVSALVGLFAEAADHYTSWKRKRFLGNHYHRISEGGSLRTVIRCALSTSLDAAGNQVKETYDKAFAIVGPDFSMGDTGRPIPLNFHVPKPRLRRARPLTQRPNNLADEEDDTTTMVSSARADQTLSLPEPPSPPLTPLTPKAITSDAASTIAPSETGSISIMTTLRPKVSVFSMFCPQAMVLQVDLSKTIPKSKRCKCGYKWKLELPNRKDFVILKEGFCMSDRFLAKSHSDMDSFGCVLCVPTGYTECYASVKAVRTHINSCHTKWQMLHERDIN
ncbi:hypothetical protein CCHL11_07447 [Colletotrichum chlorophyti]|uniref:C2H2-type domain-containing protein n=1 Tax=Colletotrichum chlorophyti TaxID=708187 RepID=A0A1Q8S6J1_9PEZI|nr:hypothetical protein CCHL11_07447 [Colletotrichum chlorophyti]